MTRLCKYDPDMSYAPVAHCRAVCDTWNLIKQNIPYPKHVNLIDRLMSNQHYGLPPIDHEMTITMYEALSRDVQGILCLMGASMEWDARDHAWLVWIRSGGERCISKTRAKTDAEWKEFLGHLAQHDYAQTYLT